MAERRRLRVTAPFLRSRSICSRKSRISAGVELLDVQLRRRCSRAFGGKGKQQPEAVGVSLAGMRAVAPLPGHVIAQEAGDQRSETGHRAAPDQCLGRGGDFGHQLRRRLQIPVGVSEVRVPHVGHQGDGVPRDCRPAGAALLQNPRCEGVAQIVDAWSPRPAGRDIGVPDDLAEGLVDHGIAEPSSPCRQKQAIREPDKIPAKREVAVERVPHARVQRDEAALAELGLANVQDAVGQDVAEP